jgi:hypothetical protein
MSAQEVTSWLHETRGSKLLFGSNEWLLSWGSWCSTSIPTPTGALSTGSLGLSLTRASWLQMSLLYAHTHGPDRPEASFGGGEWRLCYSRSCLGS